ncbi:aminoacyl-histidine dipeptidase [bacterium C-53]|nr:aminoacyl-histidine dipeptidase [Lachnospiraceae bacterium]NBI01858.1 aminoacyl-histidine dipeptidase [Lachnospiraceae bacterium]RKJ12268.1 aminoacyl-histidine dipeptidase [bacterium C-53]
MDVLKALQPQAVFSYFEDICRIPHGSGNTKEISDYLVSFAKEHSLSHTQDEMGNVIIVKEASKGFEQADTVMLQGHMDMVCEKNSDCRHDFKKDPLNLCVVDDYVFAKGTTLGGDDGIAVAMALAILAGDYEHPRLEVVVTVDEEIGMLGATGLDLSGCQAKKMINIDSEEEGILLTSCAGGLRATCSVPVRHKSKSGTKYELVVCGLNGGHSGTEIDKYLGNANIIMGRLLHFLETKLEYDLVTLQGGLQDNAIPREANANIIVQSEDMDHFEALIREFEQTIKNEYSANEKNISVYCENQGKTKENVLTPKTKERVIFLLNTVPDGVQKMSMATKGLVQTSLNFGIMRLRDNEFSLTAAVRSSVKSEKYALSAKLRYLTETIGGTYQEAGTYPAWEYRETSELRDIMVDVYEKMYGEKPVVAGIHAGMECGVIYEKMNGIDAVSCGPNILSIHTPKEKLSISSTKRTFEYLLNVLKECGKEQK